MKPGVPWSVKGIEPDVREAAKVAARRSGMTLGEWLNNKILETADDIPDTRLEPGYVRRSAEPTHALERTASRLEDIAEQLARLSRRDTETAQRVTAPVEQRLAPDNEALHKVLSRVDSNERQTVEAFTAVNDRLSVLGRQISQATRAPARVEESPGFTALEKAVRNIVEHMETSEKRTRDNFKSLHDRMAALSQKAATAPETLGKQAPAFSALESRLADLAQRVERHETSAAKSSLPDLLKNELTELANRIDTVRDTAEQLASRAQTQAVQASQAELRAIESRIVGLIKEAQSSLSGHAANPADMQRLRGEVERLNARIDDAAKGQASGGDVMALRAAVEQLSTRVAQGPDMRPIADLDRRIADVTQRLEQTQAQTRNLPQVTELERRMAELDHRLNEAVVTRRAGASEEIEERLNDIASRVERTEQQLGSLETIERAVNQLFDSMEQQRTWTQEVAENAANRMAQQVLAAGPQQISLTGTPEIQALQDGLQAVRAAAENADNRNQETLEAVHEALEQIVAKLSELETAAIGQRVAQAATAPITEVAAATTFASVAAPAVDWEVSPAPAFASEAAPSNPFEEQPHGSTIEPQLPEAASSETGNPFEASPPAPPMGMGQAADGDDFIAAARRAAQAAVQPKSVLSGLSPGAARASEEASKKLLNFSLFKSKPKADSKLKTKASNVTVSSELQAPPGLKPANNNDARRRKYVIMGIALLAAVSVFTFNMLGQAKKAKAPAKPAAIEQQLNQQAPAAQPSTVPAAPQAQPPQPKPAELESFLMPEGSDPVLTASVAQPAQDLASIVSGNASSNDLAPAEAGALQLREAAAMGNAEAQFVIATRYLNGEDGAPQDFAKAAYWYGKAAAAGNAPAQYRLGTLYERGKGVARDMKAALGWYERSASLGNVKAMHNAAVLAASNDQQKPDYARAFKWFSLGAAHGLKDSQFNLAVLLERGLGTKANPKEALFWYSVAARQNDADANKRADAIAKTLASGDLSETEKRLKLWKPEVAPDVANTVAISDPAWQANTPDAS